MRTMDGRCGCPLLADQWQIYGRIRPYGAYRQSTFKNVKTLTFTKNRPPRRRFARWRAGPKKSDPPMSSEPHRGDAVVVLLPPQGVGGVAPIVHLRPLGKHFVMRKNVAALSILVFVFHHLYYLSFIFVLYHILNSLSRVFFKKDGKWIRTTIHRSAKFIKRIRTATARRQSSAISFIFVLYHNSLKLSRTFLIFAVSPCCHSSFVFVVGVTTGCVEIGFPLSLLNSIMD